MAGGSLTLSPLAFFPPGFPGFPEPGNPVREGELLQTSARASKIEVLKIRLNGEMYEVKTASTVEALLAELNIDPRRVAVEHNLIVVKRANYENTIITEGDEVEIVNFVGGG